MQVSIQPPDAAQLWEIEANATAQTRRALARIHYRIGATVKRRAVAYAPISPSVTMLRRFDRMLGGARAGSSWMMPLKGGGRREIVMTKFYADRIDRMLSRDPRRTEGAKPGGLMTSIAFASDERGAEVFVASNSPAGKYARRIHDEKGLSWWNRGPGTQAKGPQADDKFIERAIDDSEADARTIIDDQFRRLTA